ncbi:trafficking protein particle complex subunit 12 [Diachasma alloeum]|uniref:trafficking protein particle complex subunit 12 n=1 Tax=Diachasma alloeum TaxID=454923 RepID=UPI0007381B71|nr:trafficking protein particle complex subunit 12 [Diachasma alloeum]
MENNEHSRKETSEGPSDHTLGRYFENNTPTVFDEIVSTHRVDNPLPSVIDDPTSDLELTSNFLKNDHMFEIERPSDLNVPDYHRDAWIPSESTRKILLSIATSPPGTSLPNRENLTMPGLTLQGDILDATKEASIHFYGEEEHMHRNVLTASDVTQDERGLRNLIQAGCYRAAVNLSGRLLGIYGQGFGKIDHPSKHTPHSLQLWYTRLALLTKLGQTEVLKTEAQAFGNLDKPDMYFSFHPELYGTRHGSMASFSFRLLLAEIPSFCGSPRESLDNLYAVLSTVNQILRNLGEGLSEEGGAANCSVVERQDSVKLWSRRKSKVLVSIVNCALVAKNFVLAIEVLEDICQFPDWQKDQLEIFKLALGRLHLFLGDIPAAEGKLVTKDVSTHTPTTREWVNRGLMAVTQNAFQEAYDCFQMALNADPSNVMIVNNMAVCLLYTGKLEAAVQLLENAVTKNPIKNLQESIILNMSTLYELHTTHCRQSKLQLLKQMNRYKGDATDIQCLKLV